MAFDINALTISPEEATEISQAIFEALLLPDGEIGEFHEIETGIEHKTQIPFIGNMGKVGKKITGCARDANGNQIPITEKFWDPEHIGDRLEHCAKDMNVLFKLFKKATKMNPDFFENLDGEALQVVAAKLKDAIKLAIHRLVWFGDKTIQNVADGGYLTDGEDVDFYNIITGLWKQILLEVPATVGTKNYVEITQNAAATYALQQDLPSDFALQLFRKMVNNADSRFKKMKAEGMIPMLFVTPDIYENWENFLEDKSLAFMLNRAEDGSNTQYYRGLTIKPRYDWQATIEADFDNGTKHHLPHRALMTYKENIPVGTLSSEDFENIESWYDKTLKKNFMDFDFTLDTKFLEPYLAVAAY
jgi:hypothetical protein